MEYQVALSFAGEQRCYVGKVARSLQEQGISVFYDEFEEVSLWGESLIEKFKKVYAEDASFVVMFISKEYVKKSWPSHEGRLALNCAVQEKTNFVLPVRFDNTPVPGLPEDIGFVNAEEHSPAELAAMVAEKLGIKPFEGKASQGPPPQEVSPTGEIEFDYSRYNGRYIIGSGQVKFETEWTRASNTCIHVYNDPESINGVALASEFRSIGEVKDASSLDYTSRAHSPCLGQIVVWRNVNGFYAAVQVLEIKDSTRGDDRDEVRFRYAIQSNGSDSFAEFQGNE